MVRSGLADSLISLHVVAGGSGVHETMRAAISRRAHSKPSAATSTALTRWDAVSNPAYGSREAAETFLVALAEPPKTSERRSCALFEVERRHW